MHETPPKNRSQFGLRAILCVMLIAGVGFAALRMVGLGHAIFLGMILYILGPAFAFAVPTSLDIQNRRHFFGIAAAIHVALIVVASAVCLLVSHSSSILILIAITVIFWPLQIIYYLFIGYQEDFFSLFAAPKRKVRRDEMPDHSEMDDDVVPLAALKQVDAAPPVAKEVASSDEPVMAAVVPPTGLTCPACQGLMPLGGVICNHCGHNVHSGRKMDP